MLKNIFCMLGIYTFFASVYGYAEWKKLIPKGICGVIVLVMSILAFIMVV